MLELDRIICGDCLEVLKTLPGDSVDAIVTDPPAGISFMGKEWDQDKGGRDAWIGWMKTVASECLRVIKPGGHALVWALPRTSHWTGMAWEEAGWEPRDKISHVFGSGFPKSLDISKALDKMAGAERTEKRLRNKYYDGCIRKMTRGDTEGKTCYGTYGDLEHENGLVVDTAPATAAAKQWAGWGSALKPAHEDWWLFRKPLAEKTIAENVLRWGTGAINIDACRIATNGEQPTGSGDRDSWRISEGRTDRQEHGKNITPTAGRFPANLIWSHSPNCKRIGTKKVKGIRGGNSTNIGGFVTKYADESKRGVSCGYTDADGLEEVESWDCDPSCPSWQFAKAGERKTGICPRDAASIYQDPKIRRDESKASNGGDTGSAARFFQSCPVTEEDWPAFVYMGKASRAERERGLDGMAKKFLATMGNGIGKREHNENEPAAWTHNNHPTVKPLSLMRYLCRLITPPGGLILDPFAGSGTTCLAAKMEGFRYIGIEKEPEYAEIARRRIAAIPTSLSRWVEDVRQ